MTKNSVIQGSAISTSHHLATQAGADALAAGGNAIDAALAAAATLCVVYPNNVALGGDMVALVRNPAGEVRFLNATGPAASAETLANLQLKHGNKLPLRHIDTVTVPGGVCGWNSLHEYGAKLNWAEHFTAAIGLASKGFANSKSVAAELLLNQEELMRDPGLRQVFFAQGKPLAAGETLVQPALAETMRLIAEGGSTEFYTGNLAKKWVAGLNKLGSKISLEDTDAYNAYWDDPIATSFEGLTVLTSPPNTSGFMFLRALNEIKAGLADPLGNGAGSLAQVFANANAVRAEHLGDPQFWSKDCTQLLEIDATPDTEWPSHNPSGDTVGLSAVSADGWAVSLINSIYYGFGAGILEPETGIIFQNRGTAFSLEESHAGSFAPGKRPSHTLMPALVLRGDDLAWVPATMGGSAQPQIHTQLLLNSLTGLSPEQVTSMPRWIVREPDESGQIEIMVEEDLPADIINSLRLSGFNLNLVSPHTEKLGHSNLIKVSRDGVEAASDPRSDGSAIVFDENLQRVH